MPKVRLNDKAIRRALPDTGQVELWDDLVPGFGLRLAAGGSRTFFVMKRLQGRLVRRTVGKVAPFDAQDGSLGPDELRLADARDKARKMLSDLSRGIDPAARKIDLSAVVATPRTFGEVAAAYFADPARRGGGALKSRSELERKVRVDLAAWANRPIADLTRADVRSLINAKHAKSPVSANRLLALVRRIFRWAVREDLIPANPAMDIEPTAEKERERVLTLDELAQVWAGADALGYPYSPLIKMLILTAQRRSEVAGLRWSEIEGPNWRLPDDRAKRGKGHLVPLSKLALHTIDRKKMPDLSAESGLVFTTGKRQPSKSDEPLEPVPVSGWSRMKDRLDLIIANAAAKAADEPLDLEKHALPHWTLHDLRRSVATHLRDGEVMGKARVDRLTISKILNHAEGGMTRLYDRYSSDPEKRQALEAWAAVIERVCGLNVVKMGKLA
jgi:integrase